MLSLYVTCKEKIDYFYYRQEPHLDATEMTVCHPVILDFDLGTVTQWDFRTVSHRQGLGVACEGRNYMHILGAQMGSVTQAANCSQISSSFLNRMSRFQLDGPL